MKPQPFHKELRNFIQSVVRQRKTLLMRNESRKNKCQAIRIIEEIERYLNYYPFNDDQKISRFFLQHKDQIRVLLPGTGSSCQRRREEKFNFYLSRSTHILQQS